MRTLKNVAKKIRSKNAGPFALTIDIFCIDQNGYDKASNILTPKKVSSLYKVKLEQIAIFLIPELKIIKITIPRPKIQGSAFDRDLHGASFGIILEELVLN